jgi:hypothetical protein
MRELGKNRKEAKILVRASKSFKKSMEAEAQKTECNTSEYVRRLHEQNLLGNWLEGQCERLEAAAVRLEKAAARLETLIKPR